MHWVIQSNLYSEDGLDRLLDTLARFELPHTVVEVSRETIAPPVIVANPVMVIGGPTLSEHAVAQRWRPGSFLNENFDFRIWLDEMGDHLLTHDARVCSFDEVDDYWPTLFVRPCFDTKAFTGKVMTWAAFQAWRDDVLAGKHPTRSLDGRTLVAYGGPQLIMREYRFYVVDGALVTASQYKLGTTVHHTSDVDLDIWQAAERFVARWQPARAFVIDLALTPDGIKVIEYNNINSAALYACDVQKLVMALDQMAGY